MVVPEPSINNIMGGLESTGGVTLHNHRRKLRQRFETIAKLGQGTYGKVQLGVNKETGQEVAIKTIKKCKIKTEADLIRIRREIQIMSSLRHPYIIHIYEVFENKDKIVLVMEYAAGGELYDYLSKEKVLEECEARRIFRQISMAVYYCHKHQICHRDLKLENILLDEKGNAKIADFGLSNVFDSNRLLSTFCGSPLYASPEIVKGVPYHGPEVDCWSLGVLLYTLVYGAMPFDGSNFKRLVMQISAGEYFVPKTPSGASDLIAGLLTVKGSERLGIADVCKHPWLAEEGKASCYLLAVELANKVPNRLDLLLALAPQEDNNKEGISEEKPLAAAAAVTASEKPPRSLSLSSLATMESKQAVQLTPVQLPPSMSGVVTAQSSDERIKETNEKAKERKRERSTSRSRKSEEEKSKRKSLKSKKKKEDSELASKEEIQKTIEQAKKISDESLTAVDNKSKNEIDSTLELPKMEKSQNEEIITKEKSSLSDKKESVEQSKPSPAAIKNSTINEAVQPSADKKHKEKTKTSSKPEEKVKAEDSLKEVKKIEEFSLKNVSPEPINQETAAKISDVNESSEKTKLPTQIDEEETKPNKELPPELPATTSPTTTIIPKEKETKTENVSDAKAAFERKSSIAGPSEKKPDFSLASTVNVNKLVEKELTTESLDEQKKDEKAADNQKSKAVVEADTKDTILASTVNVNQVIERELKQDDRDEKLKKENAVKVISHAISESELSEKKASTLPRRKLYKSTIPPKAVEPEHMIANTKVSQIIYPTPIPSPRPSLTKQESLPRERIIPIKIEARDESNEQPLPPKPPLTKQTSLQSNASSTASVSRQDSDSSTISVTASTTSTSIPCEPIRKSAREVIIPIAVEGGGFVTPSATTLSKMSSVSESEEDVPARGFGLHSTRRRHIDQSEAAESLSSDEDDDNFEMLTTENLFSALFNRMRNLTHKLNADEMRPSFPRLFNHSIFDSPSRRLMETKSFTHDDPTPWRTKRDSVDSTSSSSSATLPRGLTFRRITSRHDDDRQDRSNLPPPGRRRVSRILSELNQNSYQQQLLQPNNEDIHQHPNNIHSAENKSTNYADTHSNGHSRMDRVKKYLEELDREIEKGRLCLQNDVATRPKSPINRSKSLIESQTPLASKSSRPRSVYVPGTSQTSEFDKYVAFKNSLSKDFMTPRRGPSLNAYDRIKELREYRRSTSVPVEASPPPSEDSQQSSDKYPNNNQSVLEKYLYGEQKDKKPSRFLKKNPKEKSESRVDKAIKSLRKNSICVSDEFSESKLLKRAVSMENVHKEVTRTTRATSLKPEERGVEKCVKNKGESSTKLKNNNSGGTFETFTRTKKKPQSTLNDETETLNPPPSMNGTTDEKKKSTPQCDENEQRQTKLLNLKKLEFNKSDLSPDSSTTPTGDFDEVHSCISQTDNSDTWSSSDHTERYFDLPPYYLEDCVSERIRRKSFFHRFNLPRRSSYHRSASNVERKRYHY